MRTRSSTTTERVLAVRAAVRAVLFAGVAAGLGLVVALAGVPAPAAATAPVDFGDSHIVDTGQVLGGRTAEVTQAVNSLYDGTGVDLFVAYVPSFTGVESRSDWADQTAAQNGLGTNDILLAVATNDRQYQISAPLDIPLSDAQLTDVETIAIEPALRVNDWAGAGIGAATGFEAALRGNTVEASPVTPGAPTSATTGNSGGTEWVILALLAAVVATAVWLLVRRARRRRAERARGLTGTSAGARAGTAGTTLPTAELKARAGTALVDTDDAVATSEEELGFATAQFGSAATRPFQEALNDARVQLRRAFTLQQKLDDAEPDSENQRRAWYVEIESLCSAANTALDEQADDFDELRQLEARAPEAAASVQSELGALSQRLPEAEAALADLTQRYSAGAVQPVADNVAQARDRIAFAAGALAEAQALLGEGSADAIRGAADAPDPERASDAPPGGPDRGAAAVGIRAAEEALDQGALLLDAIHRRATELNRAAASLVAASPNLDSDLQSARGLDPDSAPALATAALPGAISLTEQVLGEVDAARSTPADPIALLRRVEQANTKMDAALQGVRDAAAQAVRAHAALAQTLLAARSQVSAAGDFITARRGAIGAPPRTRLAEAARCLAAAEAAEAADPAAALRQAQRAYSLAAESLRLARDDVAGFEAADVDRNGGFGSGGLGAGTRGAGQNGGDALGAILGGLLIGSMLGGGSGGSGGGRRSGGGFGGSFGGVGGGRAPGSFGGVGTRSRRGGGGRF